MATSSTLKALKEQDGPISPREQPAPVRSRGLADRLQTWQRSIWRHRWLSVAIAWVICIAGWLVIALWPTSYNASTVIYANLAELADEEAAADQAKAPAAMLKAMLLSDHGLDQVRSAVPLDPDTSQTLPDDIMLRSTVPPVFVMAYEHADPDVALQVLEAVIDGFQTRQERASAAALETANTLEQEIADHRRRLQTLEAEQVVFRRANADYLEGAGSRAGELALLEEEILSLEQEIETTVEERDGFAEALAKARAPEGEEADSEPARSQEEIATERKTLEAELAKLQQRYADTHPYVVAVFDAIKALDLEAEALAPTTEGALTSDQLLLDRDELEQRHGELIVEVSTLNSHLAGKRREIELLQALTKTTTSVEAELAEFDAAKKEIKSAIADVQQRRDELGEIEGGEATQEAFRLIKQPELPTDPAGPSRLMALAAVLLGGLGLGAITAVSCNRYKGVFESAWQLRRRFDVGVLGTISEVMTPAERKQLDRSRMAFGLACLGLIGVFSGLAIAELTDMLAPLGETLRTRLLG